jgi:hypothetical protein
MGLASLTLTTDTDGPEEPLVPKSKLDEARSELDEAKRRVIELEVELRRLSAATDLSGARLEPANVRLTLPTEFSLGDIQSRIEAELIELGRPQSQAFSFILIYGGVVRTGANDSITDSDLERAKQASRAVGEVLRGVGSEPGWARFVNEQYYVPLTNSSLGRNEFQIQLFPTSRISPSG